MNNNIRTAKKIMKVSRHDVKLWTWLVLLTLPHFNPGYLNQIQVTEMIIDVERVCSFILIFFWGILIKRKISMVTILIALQQMFLFSRTILLGGASKECVVSMFSILSIVLLYDIAQEQRKIFIASQMFCFELMIYINLLSQILFPKTMYISTNGLFVGNKNWFLGYYNHFSQYYIPALMFAYLYENETGKRIRTKVLTIAIFLSAILAWSGGVLVALFGMGCVYLFFRNRTAIFNYYNYWLTHFIFFIFFIVLKIQNLFKWLIEGILGKWNSFEMRMILWDRCMRLISANFLLGYGIEADWIRKLKVGLYWAMHAHNQLLEILYQGGITNLALFTIIIVVAGKKIYKKQYTERSKIISIAFLGWSLHALVEPLMTTFLMGMFVIAYHSE